MANFFPRWTNWIPLQLAICAGVLGFGALVAVAYYFTPKYTRVGYEPAQPVPFRHDIHAGQLGLDCRYCHSFVEESGHANVPTNQTCVNCHGVGLGGILANSPKLAKVQEARETGKPIAWRRVHQLPDYAYFDHSVHVNRGVSCVSCHGKVDEMVTVRHEEPLSMGWCLDCHRSPEKALRPVDEVFNLDWKPEELDRAKFYSGIVEDGGDAAAMMALIKGEAPPEKGPGAAGDAPSVDDLVKAADDEFGEAVTQREVGLQLKRHWNVSPPETCAACHR